MKAYTLVDNFFSFLQKRKSLLDEHDPQTLPKGYTDPVIDKINNETATKCNEIINTVDWTVIINPKQ
jgi:hypothetical protein